MNDVLAMLNARMVEILGEVDGIQGVFRDRAALPPEGKTPGILYLDGTESRKTELAGGNFTSMPVAVFTMKPQVFLVLTLRTDLDNTLLPDGTVLPVSDEMESFRAKILSAVLNDDTLVALCSDNGGIAYNGFDSDMQTGSSIGALGATVQYHFELSYVLDPSDLIS